MATSESDDFESADEEMSGRRAQVAKSQKIYKRKCIGSDSDDDVDYIPVQSNPPVRQNKKYSVPPQPRHKFIDDNSKKSG